MRITSIVVRALLFYSISACSEKVKESNATSKSIFSNDIEDRTSSNFKASIKSLPILLKESSALKSKQYFNYLTDSGFDKLVKVEFQNCSQSLTWQTYTIDSVFLISTHGKYYQEGGWTNDFNHFLPSDVSHKVNFVGPDSVLLCFLPLPTSADTLIIAAGDILENGIVKQQLNINVTLQNGKPTFINTMTLPY